jgi:hypothetical protein
VCGSWGPITGTIRYFADKFGKPRASIEGTQIPYDLLRPYASVTEGELIYDPDSRRTPLVLRRRVEYHGFELEREIEPIDEFPPELADRARHALAESLARGDARHPGAKKNQEAIDSIRETYRRSGGQTPRFGFPELTALYEEQLANVASATEFRSARVDVDADAIVSRETRERYASLPSSVEVRGKDVEIHYDVEESPEGNRGVAQLRLPEKLARTLVDEELPSLDRPLRFVVTRGARGAARGATLGELQTELDRPFTQQEIAELERGHDERRRERHDRKREKGVRKSGGELRENHQREKPSGDGRSKFHGPGAKNRGRKRR